MTIKDYTQGFQTHGVLVSLDNYNSLRRKGSDPGALNYTLKQGAVL